MSTAAASAPATIHTPGKKPVTVTRAGWYLLENLFTKSEPFTRPDLIVAAAKFYGKLRKANVCIAPDGTRFDKKYVRPEGMTDLTFAHLVNQRDIEFENWGNEALTIELGKKQEKLCDDAIEWGLKNRDKGVLPQASEHLLSLLTAFGVGQNDDGDESDE